MKAARKALCVLLAVLLSALGMTVAFADSPVTWNYDTATRTLTFSGSGPIPDYDNPDNRPWRSVCGSDGCKHVVVEPGITSIGKYACYVFRSLESVTIADTVLSIGLCAFQDCDQLLSVSLGNKVTSIGGSAFCQCYKLKTVTGGNSVETIGSNAFYSCQALQSFTLPSTLKSIGNYAFENCYKLEGVMLPAGLNAIGNRAFFRNYKMTAVSIPAGVTAIGSQAFFCCDNLETVSISAGLTSIGDYAFETIENSTALKTVKFGGTESQWNAVAKGQNIFGWIDQNGNHIPRPADKMPAFLFNVAGVSVSLAATTSKVRVTNVGGTVKGSGTYEKGTQVAIIAIPADGYVFDGWYGVHAVEGKPTTLKYSNAIEAITPNENIALAALFVKATSSDFNVTVTATEGGTTTGGGMFHPGQTAQITATANSGWKFAGWFDGGTKITSSANYAFDVTKNTTLTARFEKVEPEVEPKPTEPAHTHSDENNDGKCDGCGEQMTGGDHCPQCGKIHKGFFQKIVGFFHKIIYRLKHLFDKK